MRKSLLLRKCEDPTQIAFHLYYESKDGLDPETYLIEKDILAPWFDSMANPKYTVQSARVHAEFNDFGEALERYYQLAINWKAVETYVHPLIFKWDKRWAEGVQYPL